MFENPSSPSKQEPEDMFADTVPVHSPQSSGVGNPEPTRTAEIPELTGPVFSPGKLWTTIGIIVVVLALVGAGVWWFWWRPRQTNVEIPTSIEISVPFEQGLSPDRSQTTPAPQVIDTDGDGLGDSDEVLRWKTDPIKADTDGDGYPDAQEIKNGYNPVGDGKLTPEQKKLVP